MKSLRSRALTYGLVIALGLLSALPSLLPNSVSTRLPAWYTQHTITLGLDLQGGSHLLLEADTQTLFTDQLEAFSRELTVAMRKSAIAYQSPSFSGVHAALKVHNPAQLTQALKLAKELAHNQVDGHQRFDIQAEDGQLLIRLNKQWQQALSKDAVERSLEVVYYASG